MLWIILLAAVFYWTGYKSGRSDFNYVSPLLGAVCLMLIAVGVCFWIGLSRETAIGTLIASVWSLGVVNGFLLKRRAAGP